VAPVQQVAVSHCAASEVVFLQSLDQAPWGKCPANLARYVIAVSQSMAILAAVSASCEELLRMMETVVHV